MNQLNVAVIGIGNMGKNHARTYFDLPQAHLVAICDVNESLGRELAERYNCDFYPSYHDMFRRATIDAVSVAVPTKFHKQVALEVLGAGKHLLLEKPIAPTIAEAEDIIDCAERNKLVLMIGHIERFNPAVQRMKQIIDKGELGDIFSIMARRVGLFPPQIKDSNVIVDLGIHDLDIFGYLLEAYPQTVFGGGGKALTNRRHDHAELFLTYGGVSCVLQTNWVTPIKIRTLSVTGTLGHAELDYITQKIEMYRSNFYKSADDFGEFLIKFGEPDKVEVGIETGEPLKKELAEFCGSIWEKRAPGMTGRDGMKALEIALASVKAIDSGKVVSV